jgi:pimeloyl-ACP methyl ester carboxylesterase
MTTPEDGSRLDFEDVGDGIPLVLVHGYPLDRRLWAPQLDGLRHAARLVAPDLRGFGRSGDAPDTMTMDAYAADLKALVDGLGLGRVVVCGLSMGGYVALAFQAQYPEAVLGLVLANTRAGADSEQAREGRYAAARTALEQGVSGIADAMLPKMLTPETLANRPELAATVRAMMAAQRPSGVAAALRGMAERPDRTGDLPSIEVPTLVVTGSADTLIPVSESEALAGAIAGSRLAILEGAAHLSNLERPETFNAAVEDFLGGLGTGVSRGDLHTG